MSYNLKRSLESFSDTFEEDTMSEETEIKEIQETKKQKTNECKYQGLKIHPIFSFFYSILNFYHFLETGIENKTVWKPSQPLPLQNIPATTIGLWWKMHGYM